MSRIGSERADHEARQAFPVVLRFADARPQDHTAHDVALAGGQRAVVGQHGGFGAATGDHLSGGGLDQGGTDVEHIEQAVQAGREPLDSPVSRPGR